ncbi:MAG: hypothetical protein E6713_16255 [Sporomusaceae bacterium]|nr:hypothetical protein [Sporomusaceae bacterium]
MAELFLLACLGLSFFFSLKWRLKRIRQSPALKTAVSPLSMALTDLVATAGGIYLSLIMAAAFLKIAVPEVLFIYGLSFDPLAFFSLLVTLLQPLWGIFFTKE